MPEYCSDSPLTTTGNIISLLTFALGLFAYFIAFLSVTRTAENEMVNFQGSLEEIETQINHITEYFVALELAADPVLKPMGQPILQALSDLSRRRKELSENVQKAQYRSFSVLRRLHWWYEQKAMTATMAKTVSQRDRITAIQLTFLLRKSKNQDDAIANLERIIKTHYGELVGILGTPTIPNDTYLTPKPSRPL